MLEVVAARARAMRCLGVSVITNHASGISPNLLSHDEVMQAAIRLGGTITGEHGIGRAKRAALPDQLGPDVMALTRRIKDALDPQGILNPGAGF